MFVDKLDSQGKILNDKKRNEQARKLLAWLSNGVDQVRQQVRKAEGATPEQKLFRDYLFTIQDSTDSLRIRKQREEILEKVFDGLFDEKDRQRHFTIEQRRLIWHSDEEKKCKSCGDVLSWSNFTIDHLKAHSRGGRTTIENAALNCLSCNSKKGNR